MSELRFTEPGGTSSLADKSDEGQRWSVADGNWEDDAWLAGGYRADGTPLVVSEDTSAFTSFFGNLKATKYRDAAYAFNDTLQFWPTRDPALPASAVGSTVPGAATKCSSQDVNEGRCVPPFKVDEVLKVRFRPRMTRLDANPQDEWWGSRQWDAVGNALLCPAATVGAGVGEGVSWVSGLFGGPRVDPDWLHNDSCRNIAPKKADPADIIGRSVSKEIVGDTRWQVMHNEPCLRGSGMVSCLPCERNGSARDACDVVVSRMNEVLGPRAHPGSRPALTDAQRDHIRNVHAKLPCPLSAFVSQIGNSRIPYNIMTARGDRGGARDTPTGNFYTCEYATNAIQDVYDLRAWVDALVESDEVAPCCSSAAAGPPAAVAGPPAAGPVTPENLPRPCWFRPGDDPMPFVRGMPEDAAAVFVANFAARVRLYAPGTLCGAEAQALLAEIDRAKQGIPDPSAFQSCVSALDELADAIYALDTAVRPCVVRTGYDAKGEQRPLWSRWESIEGAPGEGKEGECSIARVTRNPRLECGSGIQRSHLTVLQQPHCGGTPCPPLVRYRFCAKSCNAPAERANCAETCVRKEVRDYDSCFAVFRSDAQCRQQTSSERERCVRRCSFRHPDFECSSNLCLTPGRVDPITGRSGPD
jgi:hypothetical protein